LITVINLPTPTNIIFQHTPEGKVDLEPYRRSIINREFLPANLVGLDGPYRPIRSTHAEIEKIPDLPMLHC
jgi:hypothetical protein